MGEYFDPANYPDVTVTMTSLNGTFTKKLVAVPDTKMIVIGRLTADQTDSPTIPRFESKVVSRQHAVISQVNGKFQIQDSGSSSGTYIKNQRFGDQPYRLSDMSKKSNWFEVFDGDMIQFGEDFERSGELFKCIQMRISLPAGHHSSNSISGMDSIEEPRGDSFVDYSADPSVRKEVEDEFNALWSNLISPLKFGKLNPQRGIVLNPPSSIKSGSEENIYTAGTFSASSSAEDGSKTECVAFIKTIEWDSPQTLSQLTELVHAGDSQVLGFHRSLKQFPPAFKDVVTKYLKQKFQ